MCIRDRMQMDDAERSRRIDTLEREIEELERAELKEGEEERLLERRKMCIRDSCSPRIAIFGRPSVRAS